METTLKENNTVIKRIISVVAPTHTVKIPLPAGRYVAGFTVRSNTTGASTTMTVSSIRQLVDADLLQVADVNLPFIEPGEASTLDTALAIIAGAQEKYRSLEHSTVPASAGRGLAIAHGLEVLLTKGSATDGEMFEVEFTFVKIG